MGTPEYAVPSLRALAEHPRVDLALIVTQPDRPQGRGRRLQSPPVRLAADELDVPVLQVATLRDPETKSVLERIAPDLIVVAAFGVILGSRTLTLPRLGCFNLHASILPKFRGANPIASAIATGEKATGVTLMQMERGLDTGPILASREILIDPTDTTATLTTRLADLAAALLHDSIEALAEMNLQPMQQSDGASLTRPMSKDDGWIEWKMSAEQVSNHARAMIPWPRAWTTLPDGTRVQVLSTSVEETAGDSGLLIVSGLEAMVGCGTGSVGLTEIQLPGGKPLTGRGLADKLRKYDGQFVGVLNGPDRLQTLVVPA